MSLRTFLSLLAAASFLSSRCAVGAEAPTQALLPAEQIPLDSLGAFRATGANWHLAGDVGGDPRNDRILAAAPGTGVLIDNPTGADPSNLLTTWEHGDIDVDLDFLVPVDSTPGIYLQGRYAVPILGRWGSPGSAFRAPGLWQHLHVEFLAPRFDAAAHKVENARFAKVELNGYAVSDPTEVPGLSPGAVFSAEGPEGPFMIAGGPGPVAIKSISVRRFDPSAVIGTQNLSYKLYAGVFEQIGEYDSIPPTRSGTLARFSQAAVDKRGRFALVIEGRLAVPRAGEYAFTGDGLGAVRLTIDGKPVVLPFERGGSRGKVTLAAAVHDFRVDYLKLGGERNSLEVSAAGPGISRQILTAPDSSRAAAASPKTLLIEPEAGRIRVQRSFVPFEPKKRLYAINVGSAAGAHYAYDFASGALLRVWRGHWLDTSDMWVERGNTQLGTAAGPSLTLGGKPLFAFIESIRHPSWPETPDPLWSSQGYRLEPDGQPVFFSTFGGLKIRDRIASFPDGRGISRTLELSGGLSDWQTWVLLAEAGRIAAQPDHRGWIVGDREWYLDWPADSIHTPVVQTTDGQQQLIVRLSKATLKAPLTYNLVW